MKSARACILALLSCWAFAAFADVAVPPLSGRVVDQTGTLSSGDVASLTQAIRALEAKKGSQVAVLIVPTTAPETIEQYSLRVAETWKIGRKKIDDGALLVVAKDDRRLRIEVGYGLEGALTDVTTKRIIDEIITPRFRNGDFAGGISAGVDRIIRVVDGETLPAPPAPQPRFDSSSLDGIPIPFILIGLLMVGAILRAALSRLVAAVVMAGLVALIAWFVVGIWFASVIAAVFAFLVTLFAEPTIPGLSDSGWSGGGGSYSGSSSSDSSSSSSSDSDGGGGGGSFGGGGASGSW
jgi:uncharacterized protein